MCGPLCIMLGSNMHHTAPRICCSTALMHSLIKCRCAHFCRFVAHPRQMRDWKGDPPNLYDISGSAHFINKCDNGVVVHRNNDPNKGPQSEVRPVVLCHASVAQV